MPKLIFTQNCDGFKSGQTVDFGAGVADIYVNRRRVATYVEDKPQVPQIFTRDVPGPKDARTVKGANQ